MRRRLASLGLAALAIILVFAAFEAPNWPGRIVLFAAALLVAAWAVLRLAKGEGRQEGEPTR